MPRFTLILLLFLSVNAFAQITFQKGYVITKDGVKQECFIKNGDWLYNPTSLEYRSLDGTETVTGTPETLSEFKVDGFNTYVQAEVDVDVSPNGIDGEKELVWRKRNMFLKLLVDGPVRLFLYYASDTGRKFFIQSNGGDIRQLVYKEYVTVDSRLQKNTLYLGQLRADAWCDDFDESTLKALKYTESKLTRFFQKANECRGVSSTRDDSGARGKTNIWITPGVTQWNVSYTDALSSFEHDFSATHGFRMGLELEFVFKFARNKWAFVVEPTYEGFKISGDNYLAHYTALELLLAVRHYSYLKDDMAIHFNAGLIPTNLVTMDSKFYLPHDLTGSKRGMGLTGGIGLNYQRFKAEVRYYHKRDLVAEFIFQELSTSRLSLILGYKLNSN